MRGRRRFDLTLAAAAAALTAQFVPTLATQPAPTPPSSTQPAPNAAELKRLALAAINDLGSEDFTVRENATQTLWAMGDVIAPALTEATRSENPEVALRAQNILSDFAYGVRPDTPRSVIDQLSTYRQGNAEQKKSAIAELIRLELPGCRVMMRLVVDEQDAEIKRILLNGLTITARPTAAQMIARSDFGGVDRLLAIVGPQTDATARDEAAWLYFRGGLEQSIKALAPHAADPSATNNEILRLACQYHALGDLQKAIDLESGSVDKLMLDAYLTEAGQYGRLQQGVKERLAGGGTIEDYGFAIAYCRLAGDQTGANEWAAKLLQQPRPGPNETVYPARALFLNERPEEAITFLLDKKEYLSAIDYLGARFDYKRAEEVVSSAETIGWPELPRILAKSAPLLLNQGRRKEAGARLEKVVRGEAGVVDLDTWMEVIADAPLAGISTERADQWLAQAISAGDRRLGDLPDQLFAVARFTEPARASLWWHALTDHRVGKTPDEAMALARRLDRHEVEGDELTDLLANTKKLAASLGPNEKIPRLQLIADTLADLHRNDEAIALREEILPESRSPAALLKLADLHAETKHWKKAADYYGQAADSDSADPKPVALQGWALTQLGHVDEGKQLIEIAHQMPLGDESTRNILAEAFDEKGLKTDAHRERELILKLGDPTAWAYADALRRLAVEVNRTDPSAAAAMWDRAFLPNLSKSMSFVNPIANLSIPALIRRAKAIGHIRKGEIEAGLADAKVCFELYPSNADSQISIVRELEIAGKKAEADALFRRVIDRYDGLRKQWPESSQWNNLVAWTCGSVGRDLDHGLECAKKGCALEPGNTAILDTLSEVYYARGEYDKALEVNAECRKAEPADPHHKKNFERFTAAKAGKKIEADPDAIEDE